MFGKKKKAQSMASFYEAEERRLMAHMRELDPDTEEYLKARENLNQIIKIRESSKEVRCRFNKSDKGQMVVKVIGGATLLAGLAGIGYYECKGGNWSGEKRKAADVLVGLMGKLPFGH